MWECPLLLNLAVVPEHARQSALGGLSGLRTLSNSFNNISTFHPSSNGSHPASPTADRKAMAVSTSPPQQTGFSPRKGAAAAAAPAADGRALADGAAAEDSKEPPPGGGPDGVAAVRSKSLLSQKLLNPYADTAGAGDATMCVLAHAQPCQMRKCVYF
jgi:hypothetical protein